MLKNTSQVWVDNDLLDNGIAPGRVGVRTAVSEAVSRQMFQAGFEGALFVVEKGRAVGDEILKVPELWTVHRWIVDFCYDPVPEGEPDQAGSRISGSHPILSSMRPSGLDAGRSKSLHPVGYVNKFHFLIRFR